MAQRGGSCNASFAATVCPKSSAWIMARPSVASAHAACRWLSVWWRRLGIRVEFGRPAHPEDNAAHEQMHKIYQAEVAAMPAKHPAAQQRRSDRWRWEYNHLRPHEALKLQPPAQHYHRSERVWPRRLPRWKYPAMWSQGQVSADGRLFWRGRQRFIGRAFAAERIALRPRGTDTWEVLLGSDLLGLLHQHDRSRSLRPARFTH